MIQKIQNNELNKIKHFFKDIRFYMGNSVLNGLMGEAFVDNLKNPNIAFLAVRKYCFISGTIEKDKLKKIIDDHFKDDTLIPNNDLCIKLEEIYKDHIIKGTRYSLKKDPCFDQEKLESFINKLPKEYSLLEIDSTLEKRIKDEKFINITDNYEKYGIGFCCLCDNEIIGVASSSIFYNDGIEVNIKVKENSRMKGIATAMGSKLILECLKVNRKISWDAANENSLNLAKKLGFEYDSTYPIYNFF